MFVIHAYESSLDLTDQETPEREWLRERETESWGERNRFHKADIPALASTFIHSFIHPCIHSITTGSGTIAQGQPGSN